MATIAEEIRANLILLNLSLLRIDFKAYPVLSKCATLVGRAIGIVDFIKKIPMTLRNYKLYMPEDI